MSHHAADVHNDRIIVGGNSMSFFYQSLPITPQQEVHSMQIGWLQPEEMLAAQRQAGRSTIVTQANIPYRFQRRLKERLA